MSHKTSWLSNKLSDHVLLLLQVSCAADSCQGGGHCVLVLADKNLVPAPRDNIQRVTDIIRRSGGCDVTVEDVMLRAAMHLSTTGSC